MNSTIDLNLQPDSSTTLTTTTSTSTSAFLTPKTEPFDDVQQGVLRPPPPAHAAPPSPQEAQLLRAFSNHVLGLSHGPQFAPQTLAQHDPLNAYVYSEFNRVSELFRSAFSAAEAAAEAAGAPRDDDIDEEAPLDEAAAGENPLALVPAADPEATNDRQVTLARRASYRLHRRSSELVRMMDLGPNDVVFYRDQVRRTLMIYNALRVLSGKVRGNFIAATLMRTQGLWINRDKRFVGSIPGIHVGDIFLYRMELCVIGLHGQTQAGIDYVRARESSNGEPIATSIIVSGGYEDDEDAGDVITYTGHGGQDQSNHQCAHQELVGGNLALERSMHYGIEIRVIRGIKNYSSGMQMIYVYDGLYRITDFWFDGGRSGFRVCKYKLERMDGQREMGSAILKLAKSLKISPLQVRPVGYLSLDLSKGTENVPVLLFNDIDGDKDPLLYEYLPMTVFPPFVHQQSKSGTGCACEADCGEDCLCIAKNGGEFPYSVNGLLIKGKSLVFECGPHCRCPPSCRNRVSQKGRKLRLEIFRSRETGWAVRSLDVIQAGSFVCEYTGVILTREQAQIIAMNGDGLVYPSRFTPKWEEWGDLSKVFSEFVRPTFPSIPPLDFAMDVSKMRNLACYISQSQMPNLLVQNVLYDHNNVSFPHLMLFALENIPPLMELSLDYGVPDDWSGKPLLCN
ncbi:hypothetical protein SAY86_011120 [Trapa natans]|uniref:Uncharacterized protein n=1 Tax=Trapa natans TaxID=22666 RepID=A0AAN7LIC5_TRANT|nr:hypothetical protein SAY86_011120 [Trapa natans]